MSFLVAIHVYSKQIQTLMLTSIGFNVFASTELYIIQ